MITVTIAAILGLIFTVYMFVWSPFVAWRSNRARRLERREDWDRAQRYRQEHGVEPLPLDERP